MKMKFWFKKLFHDYLLFIFMKKEGGEPQGPQGAGNRAKG